jgi:hypothetical protein
MRPEPEEQIDESSDIDVEVLPPAPAPIPYSTTPFIPAKALEKAPPGFVKDARGYVPKPADLDPIFKKFVEKLCAVEELKDALAVIGSDRATKLLYELIRLEKKHGPGSATSVRAAKKCGIGIDGLAQLWREHSTALAMTKLIAATPKIAEDLVEASANQTIVCPGCRGEGVIELQFGIEQTRECPQCSGKGSIRRAGDKDAREHALEWAGVINQPTKGAGLAGSNFTYVNLVLPRK